MDERISVLDMSVWNAIDSDLEILRHEDCLGALGFFEFLKSEGLNDDDVIPSEHRERFYKITRGDRVPFLVVSNNLSKTVAPEVVKGFDNIFQEGINLTGAILTSEDSHKELKRKFEQREFKPGNEMIQKGLLVESIFWYRARQLRQRRRNLTNKEIFATVNGEMELLKKDMTKFVDFTIQASMISFMQHLEQSGYQKHDATAIKVNIVTLHSQAGVIIYPEEDAEMIRDNERKAKKEEKQYFDPSFM
jgi:hypothetical protein